MVLNVQKSKWTIYFQYFVCHQNVTLILILVSNQYWQFQGYIQIGRLWLQIWCFVGEWQNIHYHDRVFKNKNGIFSFDAIFRTFVFVAENVKWISKLPNFLSEWENWLHLLSLHTNYLFNLSTFRNSNNNNSCNNINNNNSYFNNNNRGL